MKKEVKFRLAKHIAFLESELKDYETFQSLSWKEYNDDRNKRRNVERWIENIINSSIDIAKIIINAEGKNLPDTYKDTISALCIILNFNEEDIKRFSELVRLRNVISHEYLDIRWTSIQMFIMETMPLYKDFFNRVHHYLKGKIEDKE